MTRPDTPPGQADAEIRWSKRQREVLDLLAARKTNGEIAEELGISLDGAKYHVREVLDRLDVDTREEAAEWWRQQQGLPARLRIVTRRMRVPAMLKLAGAGGTAAVVAVATLAIIFATTGDDDSFAQEPGLWVAVAIPISAPDPGSGISGEWELRIVKSDGTQSRTIGEPGMIGIPSWSPDGRRLAVVRIVDISGAPDAIDSILEIHDLISGDLVEVELPESIGASVVHWSPDGTRMALNHSRSVVIYTAEGDEAGSFSREPFADHDDRFFPTGVPTWSDDSSRLAVTVARGFAVLDANGELVAISERDSWLPSVSGSWNDNHVGHPALSGWNTDGELEVFVAVAEHIERNGGVESSSEDGHWTFTGTISGSTIEWSEEVDGEIPLHVPGGLNPTWMHDFEPFDNYFPMMEQVSPGGFAGSVVLHREDDERPLGPRGVPEGTSVALVLLHDNGVVTMELDIDEQVVASAGSRGGEVWWDAVFVDR